MENKMNKLLIRQIKRHFGSLDNLPFELKGIMNDINITYESFEDDAQLLQNSIEISSQELRNAFQKHKQDAEAQKLTIDKIKKAIHVINPSSTNIITESETTFSDSSYLFDSLIKLIEEHKRAEEEITKLSKAVEQNPASIVITDINGNIEYVNPKFCNLTGYTKEEAIGKNPSILKSDSTPKEYFKVLWKTILSGNEWRGELQNKKKNGELYWETALISPIINENRKITHFIAIKEDITERKLAEEARIKQAGLITSLLDSIPDLIFFKDTESTYLGCNPSFAEFVGRPKNEIIGKNDYDLFDNETASLFRSFDSKMLLKKMPHHNEEWITYPDGRKILIDTLKTPYWASDGSLIGILGISRDITKRKKAEDDLQQSSQKFEAIIKASPDGIGMVSIDGKIQLMSEKLASIHGYSIEQKEDYINKTIFDFIDPSNHKLLIANIQKLLSGTKDQKITEYMAVRKDNSKFYSDVNSTVLLDSMGNPSSILFIERDITERKIAEDALHNERALFRTIIDLIPDAVYVKDTEGRKILANPKEVQFAGKKSEDEIIGKTDSELYPTEQAKRSLDEDKLVLQSGKPILNIEGSLTDKEGKLHSLLISKVPLYDVQGKMTGLVGVTHDITSLKKAEQELIKAKEKAEDSERKFMSIIQSQAEGIGFVNQNEIFEFANTASERIFETEVNELIGTSLYDYLKPEEKEKIDQQTRNRGDGYVNSYELQIFTKKGNTKYINVTATPKMDSNNNYLGAYGVFQDITERKKAEEEVKRVSTRLALATFAGKVGVWELDIVNNILLWDDQMFALYGMGKENFKNEYQTWLASIYPQDMERADKEIQMAIRGEKDFDTEFQICRSDGTIHNIRALATVQTDDFGKPLRMIGTNWDITEQKKTEAGLLKARQEAELANKSKSVFLANMSHEIRTPLNAIIGFSQLMNRDKYLTESQKEYNNSIIRAGEHLLSLINDILELSKMEAGRLELNPLNIDLYSLLSDIQTFFKEQSQSKHLQFIFETAVDLPQYVVIDDNKLRRIFINLIGNAMKFTEEGGIAVRTRFDKINEYKGKLIVEIQDSGPGISKDEIDKLFKHFVQTSTGINKSSGTGLGLALSRELAILMGGDITVSSELGKGSIFTFQVDIEVGKADSIQDEIKKRIIGIENRSERYRILVVDDKEENLQVVVRLLNMVGFETKEAVNGQDAITKFEEWDPHLILMDMRMPVMDGYEATHLIKSTTKGKQTPIIALTASSFEDERKKTISLGIQGYIRKPFRESELFGTIGIILGINYIYEENSFTNKEIYSTDGKTIDTDISLLPADLVSQMQDAIAVADLDRLIELIQKIDTKNLDLARHLMVLANNFDYDYLQLILSKKEIRS